MDNDKDVCDQATPPLSSVELATERIGYETAAMLDRLMAHRRAASRVVLVPPVGVVTRQSSNIFAVADSKVAAALRFIRQHAHENINVSDTLRAVPIARRSLEERFVRLLGRSPLAEIVRVRTETAKHLLARTDLSVADVAERAGFIDVKRMYVMFRRVTGTTPARWRRSFRLGSGSSGDDVNPPALSRGGRRSRPRGYVSCNRR